jgi:hypothetical protein
MPVTSKRPRRLSDADLERLLPLIKGADSVELKLTVPDSEQRATVAALGMDPLDAQIRQVFFFDTPDLALNQHGVVVRARRVQQRGDDSVVKLRPVVPGELPAGLRASKNLVVEVDAMPGGYVCSASFKGTLGTTDVQRVAAGKGTIRKLFSKGQRAFFTAHAPEGIGLDDLTMLGPINLMKLKFSPAAYGGGWSPSCGCTRRLADPGAVHQVRVRGGVPGRRRATSVPRRAGCRSVRRAADQDQDGPPVLLEEPDGCGHLVTGRSGRRSRRNANGSLPADCPRRRA